MRINEIIKASGMSEETFFGLEIAAWKNSKQRAEMITGQRYYDGYQDILQRKRQAIGRDGKMVEVSNLPNNKVPDNQYAKAVDQKTNYLLGKPITYECDDEAYLREIKRFFGARFQRLLRRIGKDSLNSAVGWVYVYYDEHGELQLKRFPGYQILPYWQDEEHERLDCAVRLYEQEVWEGLAKTRVERVEIYKPDGIYRYVLDGYTLTPDRDHPHYSPYLQITGSDGRSAAYQWDRIPLVAFRSNDEEVPLIRRAKGLQDAINDMLSDFVNLMQQDGRNTILVIRDYDGENLGEFREKLALFGAVKVTGTGGVDSLQVQVNAENFSAILRLLKDALISNTRSYDAKDDRMSNNPNEMNIQSMYSDIDLDANGMETEYQAAMEELLWFFAQHCRNRGLCNPSENAEVSVIFNRDVLINESESIANCVKSVGILSDETIVAQHPWVKDVKQEMDRIKQEKQEAADEYAGAFGQAGQGPNQRNSGQPPGVKAGGVGA